MTQIVARLSVEGNEARIGVSEWVEPEEISEAVTLSFPSNVRSVSNALTQLRGHLKVGAGKELTAGGTVFTITTATERATFRPSDTVNVPVYRKHAGTFTIIRMSIAASGFVIFDTTITESDEVFFQHISWAVLA